MAYDDRFWNSESGDRVYDAEEWDYFSKSIASDGYVPDSAHLNGGLWVRQADPADMSVNVDTGHMWIDGKHFRVHTSAENLAVATADADNDRIDRAIVRVNRTTRETFPTVKTGTAGTSPSPPSLQQDSSIWELSLAQIYVSAGVSSITDSDITDERVPSVTMPQQPEHGDERHSTDFAEQAALDSHTSDTENPHNVTTGQIGAAVEGHEHNQVNETVISDDTNHTLGLNDAGRVVLMQPSTGDVTLTVPPDASVNFPDGTVVEVYQHDGGGSVNIAPGSGVTLRSPYGQTGQRQVGGQYATATLRKRGTDQWILGGDIA